MDKLHLFLGDLTKKPLLFAEGGEKEEKSRGKK